MPVWCIELASYWFTPILLYVAMLYVCDKKFAAVSMSNKCIQIEYAVVWSVLISNTEKKHSFQEYFHHHFTPWERHWLLKKERMYHLLLKKQWRWQWRKPWGNKRWWGTTIKTISSTNYMENAFIDRSSWKNQEKCFLKKHAGFRQKQSCKCSSSYEHSKEPLKELLDLLLHINMLP